MPDRVKALRVRALRVTALRSAAVIVPPNKQ
jgi:hypothetical protein